MNVFAIILVGMVTILVVLGSNLSRAEATDGIVKNEEYKTVKITKDWNVPADTMLPESIEMTLLADGVVYQVEGHDATITLSPDNNWEGTWRVPKYKDEKIEINYSVKETQTDGFTISQTTEDTTNEEQDIWVPATDFEDKAEYILAVTDETGEVLALTANPSGKGASWLTDFSPVYSVNVENDAITVGSQSYSKYIKDVPETDANYGKIFQYLIWQSTSLGEDTANQHGTHDFYTLYNAAVNKYLKDTGDASNNMDDKVSKECSFYYNWFSGTPGKRPPNEKNTEQADWYFVLGSLNDYFPLANGHIGDGGSMQVQTFYLYKKVHVAEEVQQFTITNQVASDNQTTSITFTKMNEAGMALKDAGFTLYDASNNEVVESEVRSAADGTVRFDEVPIGDYKIKETTTPVGYQTASDLAVQVLKTAEGNIQVEGLPQDGQVVDKLNDVNLVIDKVDDQGNPVSGVKFKLTETEAKVYQQEQAADSKDGHVFTFDSLRPGTYNLEETQTPDNFQPASLIQIVISEDGSATVDGKNEKVELGEQENRMSIDVVNSEKKSTTTKTKEYKTIKVVKKWDVLDESTIPESIEMTLFANGVASSRKDATVSLQAASKWQATWTVPKYDNNNKEIQYTVEETPVTGFTVSDTTVKEVTNKSRDGDNDNDKDEKESSKYVWVPVTEFEDEAEYILATTDATGKVSALTANPSGKGASWLADYSPVYTVNVLNQTIAANGQSYSQYIKDITTSGDGDEDEDEDEGEKNPFNYLIWQANELGEETAKQHGTHVFYSLYNQSIRRYLKNTGDASNNVARKVSKESSFYYDWFSGSPGKRPPNEHHTAQADWSFVLGSLNDYFPLVNGHIGDGGSTEVQTFYLYKKVPVTVPTSTKTITITNSEAVNQTTNFSFTKEDGAGNVLSGVEFSLYDREDGNVSVQSVASNEAGLVSFENISAGRYTLKETKVPVGFQKGDDISIEVTADKTGKLQVSGLPQGGKVVNLLNDFQLVIQKVDQQGKAVANAGFNLTQTKEGGYQKQQNADNPKGNKFTFVALKPGTYKLEETSTPEGFQQLANPIDVVIMTDGTVTVDGLKQMNVLQADTNTIEIQVINERLGQLPSTGGKGIVAFLMIGMSGMVTAGGYFYKRKLWEE